MAPPNLQGLNIVHPTVQADSHDLLSGQPYPDLSAQLDLWTNLTFENDDPLSSRPSVEDKYARKSLSEEEEDDAARSPATTEKAVHDGHINVVTGINLGNSHESNTRQHQPQQHHTAVPPFDVGTFLAGFGIDPYALPAAQPQHHPISPSLAQLLAYHSATAAAHHHLPTFSHPGLPPISSTSGELPGSSYLPNLNLARSASPTPSGSEERQPSAKRARTRKASISTANSPEIDAPTNSASAAEDKRRRNTAASARFRMKKKEREAALEGKAKELEQKVSELERECEGLRRENGWLKGLVVGVTGAAQGPVVSPPASLMAPTGVSPSNKRRREDESA